LPKAGLSNWKYDKINRDGKTMQRRFYDHEGNAFKDIDMTNHGQPQAHPYASHVHEWNQGWRNEKFRKPKDWEKEMAKALRTQVTKNELENKEAVEEVSPYSFCHFASVEDFMKDIACGAEVEFEYGGHKYTIAGYNPPEAWEWKKEETWQKFKDIPDMFENFKVHTGEPLRKIATEVGITDDYGGFVELIQTPNV
jgi:hypothetical protein